MVLKTVFSTSHNFDPAKSKNPFAYFTQIIHYAFLRRIQKEKKQLDIKTKIIEKTGYDEVMTVDDSSCQVVVLIIIQLKITLFIRQIDESCDYYRYPFWC